MPKDYHKGVKLQCWIPEELNNRINDCIEKTNHNRKITNCDEKYNKSTLVKEAIEYYIDALDQYPI